VLDSTANWEAVASLPSTFSCVWRDALRKTRISNKGEIIFVATVPTATETGKAATSFVWSFPVSASSRGWLIPTYLSLHQGDVKFLPAREWISDFISEVMLNTWPEACRCRKHHPHDAMQKLPKSASRSVRVQMSMGRLKRIRCSGIPVCTLSFIETS
jgi:hypothetical protein